MAPVSHIDGFVFEADTREFLDFGSRSFHVNPFGREAKNHVIVFQLFSGSAAMKRIRHGLILLKPGAAQSDVRLSIGGKLESRFLDPLGVRDRPVRPASG